jgi:iron complex outermembrane receptor protein
MLQFITNDFFGGALKVEERIIYATLKDRTTLLSNDAGFIGNIIGTLVLESNIANL